MCTSGPHIVGRFPVAAAVTPLFFQLQELKSLQIVAVDVKKLQQAQNLKEALSSNKKKMLFRDVYDEPTARVLFGGEGFEIFDVGGGVEERQQLFGLASGVYCQ